MSKFTDQLERRYTHQQLFEIATQDILHLDAAQGWIGLNLYQEAQAELAKASPFAKMLVEYMEIQSVIHAANHQWRKSLEYAEAMIIEEPDNEFGYQFRADAIRHLKGAAVAYENLAGVIGKFPASPLVKYNLGCYACVGGKLFSARRLLVQTFRLAQVTDNVIFFRNLAQTDEDLRPLWPEISRIKEIASRLNRTRMKIITADSHACG